VNIRLHILPELGGRPVASINRVDCRQLILRCREKGLSVKSIENICRTLSSLLSQAVEDGVLPANPVFRLGRHYGRANEPKHEIRPLSREEVAVFLDTARKHAPREHPLFLCALRTGMRLGELLGLQWDRVFYRLLPKAELRRIRFHDLRHTYASLLIQNGESLAYVRDQLGHASIKLTVDTYGHLVPGANRQPVDRLDDAPEAIRHPGATENTKGATA
jgi:integrase